MQITRDRLNREAIACEEAQSRIRLAVKEGIFKRKSRSEIDKQVRGIILACLSKLSTDALKNAAYRSLVNFYKSQSKIAEQMRSKDRLILFLALSTLVDKQRGTRTEYGHQMSLKEARDIIRESVFIPDADKVEILNYGNALNKYHEDYIKEDVVPLLDRMAKEEALDPDSEKYLDKRSTLRNRAEREVRYQWHLDELEKFKAKGVKLVIVSSHANCSPRCSPWQGRVYSLDGTYGRTDDGREFEPLENATNIRTPDGKWYNGLFGFNCRHYMVEYKTDYEFPTVSLGTEAREYAIDKKQRYYERQVREWRARAETLKGVDPIQYRTAKSKAEAYNKRYIAFSREHKRGYYPSRTRIL